MPIIEPESGDVGHGVGGGQASRNNVSFSPGGFGGWFDRDRAAFANASDNWTASLWDELTGAIARLGFFENGQRLELAGNSLKAGGGVAALWTDDDPDNPNNGVWSTTGFRVKRGGLIAVGPTGEIAYVPVYQNGAPVMVRERDGSEWRLTDTAATSLTLLGQRRAMWQEGMAVRVLGLPQPQYRTEGGIWFAQPVFVAGAWWILYYSGKRGIILHSFASSDACFPILPTGNGWPRVSALGPDTVRIAISRTEGEGPGDIWGWDLNVRTGDATPLPFGNQPQTPTHFDWVPTDSVNDNPTPNRAPSLVNPGPQRGQVGDRVSLALIASDVDGDDLVFAADGLPRSLLIDARSGVISGSLTAPQQMSVTARVSDGRGGVAECSFMWLVTKPVDPPKPKPPLYQPIQGVPMATQRGWFIGPGDGVLQVNSDGSVTFTKGGPLSDAALLERTPVPNDAKQRFVVRSVPHPEFALTTDATIFTPGGDVCRCYYGARLSDAELGFYQYWAFGKWQGLDIITGAVPYIEQGADHGRQWMGAGLTWVPQS